MRRFWIMLLAVAMALVIALPAGAGKPCCNPDGCGDDPYTKDHPACGEDDPDPVSDDWGGHTCVDYKLLNPDSDWIAFDPVDADFVLTLNGGDKGCVDVIAHAGVWLVDVTTDGGRGVMMIPRDSFSPGDSCGGAIINGDPTGDYTLPLAADPRTEIPASTVNACGTEYGEQSIARVDGVWVDYGLPEMNRTDDVDPLAFIVSAGGSPKSTTTISVDLPDPPPAD